MQQINTETQAKVEDLALAGHTAAQIHRQLVADGVPADERPSLRTLQRVVRTIRFEDQSGPWSLSDANGDEALLILPILRAYLNLMYTQTGSSDHRLYLTKAEARWVVRLSRVASELDVFNLYRLVRAYLGRESRGQPTYDLDALVAYTPWDDTITPHGGREYSMREAYQSGIREGWLPPAPAFLMHELAGIKWNPKTKQEGDLYTRAVFGHEPDAYEEAALYRDAEPPVQPAQREGERKGGARGKARKR